MGTAWVWVIKVVVGGFGDGNLEKSDKNDQKLSIFLFSSINLRVLAIFLSSNIMNFI